MTVWRVIVGCRCVSVCTQYQNLEPGEMEGYDCIISYLDDFEHQGGFAERLADYVLEGGSILALHNGIITQKESRLEAVYGGNFVGHPPCERLKYFVKRQADGAAESTFYMEEEPYMVRKMDNQSLVFLSFEYRGTFCEAGWYRRCGKGEMIYLAPGHDERTFRKEEFKRVLAGCAAYLCGEA